MLARNNFLQPDKREYWPDTLGEALVPKTLDKDELDRLLAYWRNDERRRYIDRSKPIYYVDCDMGAILLMSTASRLGWDVRLVEVPDHNFVRWHLPSGDVVNWDWTRWSSQEDDAYLPNTELNRALMQRGVHLRSYSPVEARAYYLGLVASKIKDPKHQMALFEYAIADGPHLPRFM